MSDVKRLLEEATPLPWLMKEVIGGGPVSIDLQESPNAALIVYAVNRLPDYEAAAEALEGLLDAVARHTEPSEPLDDAYAIGRAAVNRLRAAVPA